MLAARLGFTVDFQGTKPGEQYVGLRISELGSCRPCCCFSLPWAAVRRLTPSTAERMLSPSRKELLARALLTHGTG